MDVKETHTMSSCISITHRTHVIELRPYVVTSLPERLNIQLSEQQVHYSFIGSHTIFGHC
jgi:hypothetical protein